MRVVVFTPVSKTSAIARVSVLVASSLRKLGHDVEIVSTESRLIPVVEQFAELRCVNHWQDNSAVEQLVEISDVIVHQIGDNFFFHEGSVVWLDKVHGIVCLHDFFLGGLFFGWSRSGKVREDEAERVLNQWYGRPMDWFYRKADAGDIIAGLWPTVTFVEWIVSKADGVVTHSDFGLDAVLQGTGAPIAVVPLPYNLHLDVAQPDSTERTDDRLRILTFGRINPNKSAEAVIRAIGSLGPLKEKIQYRLAGAIDDSYRDDLIRLAGLLNVDVVTLGSLSDAALSRELREADTVVCVRVPSIEAASASAIEGMLSGKVMIVANTGFYRSLPSTAVLKIELDVPRVGIARQLRDLAEGRIDTAVVGAKARAYALKTFQPNVYAAAIVDMAQRVDRDRPVVELARAQAQSAAEWNLSPGSKLLRPLLETAKFFSAQVHSD